MQRSTDTAGIRELEAGPLATGCNAIVTVRTFLAQGVKAWVRSGKIHGNRC
jgi:hypothetical protein